MAQTISRAGWLRILFVTLCGVAILPYTPGGQSYWRYYLAERHVTKLRPLIQKDPPFMNVRLDSDLGMGGALLMKGEVNGDADLRALKKVAMDSNPPVKIWYYLHTLIPETTAGLVNAFTP